MIYSTKIKINGVEILEGGGVSAPSLSSVELLDVVSQNGLEIGAAASSRIKVVINNPHKSSFDGDKVELYISETDDGETTTKEQIEEEVGDSATTELIDTAEEIYTEEPDEEEGEPLTDDEIAEVDAYSSELEDLQIKFLEGEEMEIEDVETAEEEDPEWELVGTYWARSQTSSADSVILTCYDNISRLNTQYSQAETVQTFAEHWAAIKAELAEYGIVLDDFESIDNTPLQFLPLTTMRDALSLLAGYAGGFLACAPDGSLGISFYGYAGEILIRDDLLSISDTSSGEIVVDAVECEGTHGEIITAGGGGQAVRMSNYLVTQDVLESVIVPLYRGTRYTGGALSCPWSRELTAGEFVRVMTADEYRNYLMLLNSEEDTKSLRSSLGSVLLISSQTIKFGGTATSVIYSACESETAKSQYTQTAIKKQIINADKKAEDAAHTATDFLLPQTSETTDDGLIVCPKAEIAYPRNYARITQRGLEIYVNGRRAAKFTADYISLGEESDSATIGMCKDAGKLQTYEYVNDFDESVFQISLQPYKLPNETYDLYGSALVAAIVDAIDGFFEDRTHTSFANVGASSKEDASQCVSELRSEVETKSDGTTFLREIAGVTASASEGHSRVLIEARSNDDGIETTQSIVLQSSDDGGRSGATINADEITLNTSKLNIVNSNEQVWSGSMYMNANQTVNTGKTIDQITNGLVLCFSKFNVTDSVTENSGWHYEFVPKWHIVQGISGGITMSWSNPAHSYHCAKYLYVEKNSSGKVTITGHANNTTHGTGSNGITYDNRAVVLRKVLIV